MPPEQRRPHLFGKADALWSSRGEAVYLGAMSGPGDDQSPFGGLARRSEYRQGFFFAGENLEDLDQTGDVENLFDLGIGAN